MTCVLYEERLQVLKKHRCKIEDKIKAIKQASELPELSIRATRTHIRSLETTAHNRRSKDPLFASENFMKSSRAAIVGLNRHTSSSLRFFDAPFLMKGVIQLNVIHLHKVVVSSGDVRLLASALGQASGLEK